MLLGSWQNNLEIYIVLVASEQLVLYWALSLGWPIVHNIERGARARVGGTGVTKEPQRPPIMQSTEPIAHVGRDQRLGLFHRKQNRTYAAR